jgi:hypothetical protein
VDLDESKILDLEIINNNIIKMVEVKSSLVLPSDKNKNILSYIKR